MENIFVEDNEGEDWEQVASRENVTDYMFIVAINNTIAIINIYHHHQHLHWYQHNNQHQHRCHPHQCHTVHICCCHQFIPISNDDGDDVVDDDVVDDDDDDDDDDDGDDVYSDSNYDADAGDN